MSSGTTDTQARISLKEISTGNPGVSFSRIMLGIGGTLPHEVTVLVEDSDSHFIVTNLIVNKNAVIVVVTEGKPLLYRILREMESNREYRTKLVIGIADADHERLSHQRPPYNCFWFDRRDLEVFLLYSAAFFRLMDRIAPGIDALTARENIFRECSYLGAFRYTSAVQKLNISFQGLKLDTMFDAVKQELDRAAVSAWIAERYTDFVDIDRSLQSTHVGDYVRGHDATDLLAAVVRVDNKVEVGAAGYELLLQLTVNPTDLSGSALIARLKEWEDSADVVLLLDD